jgi:hypothetical protein
MYSHFICYRHSFITSFLLCILLFPTLCFALEFAADDIQIAGYDPTSRYLGFVLIDESNGGNEAWWVIELATGKAINCYDIRRMSLEEGGMQAVYRTRAQLRFADMKLTAGKDARTSMRGDELELPNGKLSIEESKGGFAFTVLYLGDDGKKKAVFTDDLTNLRHELGQPPGYSIAGGKVSPNENWLAMILDYENGGQSLLPQRKLEILNLGGLGR